MLDDRQRDVPTLLRKDTAIDMGAPVLKICFVPRAYTEREGPMKTLARFELVPADGSSGVWTMEPQTVTFPTGDKVEVNSEVTGFANYFHAYQGEKRLCSVKTRGSIDIEFLLQSGHEAYAFLSL
jgi:hypothetical protein